MRRCGALSGVLLVVLLGAVSSAADPSDSCDIGFLPASTTPAGTGLRIDGSPGRMTVTACNDGSAVPAPGHVRAAADTVSPSATVILDGDPESRLLPCSDGYMAVRVSGQGVAFYENEDGGFTTRARPKNAQDFASDAARHCTGTG